jgi:site-specific DNA recombinase
MKKCVIYSRVSSDQQDYSSQVDELINYAKSLSFKVDNVFSEKVSGYDQNADRAEYDKMKLYVLANDIRIILMWEISRMSRNTLRSLQEIKEFSDNGIDLYFKKEGIHTLGDEPSTKLLLSIMSTMAEMERDSIASRASRGLRASALKGKRTGLWTIPYGYKSDNGFLAIDKEEAETIRLIFKMAKEGTGFRSIASHLNSLGIPTRWTKMGRKAVNKMGKETKILWKPNSISIILKNPLYKGERHYKEDIIKTPAIVSEALWGDIQDILKDKPGIRKRRTKYNYMLRGYLKCGHCGRSFTSVTESRYNNPSFYYCYGAKDLEIRCKVGQYKTALLDKAIYESLWFHKDAFNSLLASKKALIDPKEKEKQILYYQNEIVKGEKKLFRVLELFKEGIIEKKELTKDRDEIMKNRAEYEGKISVLQAELKSYHLMDIKIDDIYSEMAPENEFANRKSFIDRYLDKVIIRKAENTEIDFNELVSSDPRDIANYKVFIKGEKTIKGPSRYAYLEIYAFGSKLPMKALLSTKDGMVYFSDKLNY